MKINRLDDLQVFVTAADAGSFTEGARRLQLSPAAVSAVIKRLEQGLGERLFERSTRRVRLSEAGERLLGPAREALRALAQCEDALAGSGTAPGEGGRLSGPLRMSLPSDLGRQHLLRWLDEVLAAQPAGEAGVELRLAISDRVADLLAEPVDVAVRYGAPEDSGHIALPLAPANRRLLVAAPAYLARHGTPAGPADLRRHQALRFVLGDVLYSRWRLQHAQWGEQSVEVRGPRLADDGALVRQWAVAGQGVAYKSALDVAEDVAAGRLQVLLPGWGEPAPLYLVVVSRPQLRPGLRHLAAELARRCDALLAPLGLSR